MYVLVQTRIVGAFKNLPGREQLREVIPNFDDWFYSNEDGEMLAVLNGETYRLMSLPPTNGSSEDALVWEKLD